MRSSVCSVAFALLSISLWKESACADAWMPRDVRPGMKGYGLTVMHGTHVERFDVEILGMLRDVQPGRDMVLARCAGLGLEKMGVAAGMSGSPVYIDDRLLGAIAYTWEFGLEPIAGITPFTQMVAFADNPIRADEPLDRRTAQRPTRTNDKSPGQMIPIRTPLAIGPASSALIEHLRKELDPWHLLPIQAGDVPAGKEESPPHAELVPGSAIGVGLVTGDINVTALGTVTAIEGDRVHAFGHPFLTLGKCELPMMSAYIHLVLPLQSASLKLGSAMETIGRFDADVSTGISGTLSARPKMVPTVIHAQGATTDKPLTLRCEVAPVPAMFGSLFLTTLAGGLDAAGQAPAEMTARIRAKIVFASHAPIEIDKTFSGESASGIAGLTSALSSVSSLIAKGANNPFAPLQVESVECHAHVTAERTSATIAHAWAEPAEVVAGESVDVVVEFSSYRSEDALGQAHRTIKRYSLAIPKTLAAGEYRIDVNPQPIDWGLELRRQWRWSEPTSSKDLVEAIRQEAAVRPSTLAIRLDTKQAGISNRSGDLVDLPPGVASILASNPREATRSLTEVVIVREETPWPLEGSRNVTIRVTTKPPLRFSAPKETSQ
ncbi:hypothetical protein K2X85_02375 [bacterium]|nr:hypothetical protein [bacterium]